MDFDFHGLNGDDEFDELLTIFLQQQQREHDAFIIRYQQLTLFAQLSLTNGWTIAMACFPGAFRSERSNTTNHGGYWLYHQRLNDDDDDVYSCHSHYRVNQRTFNWLVETLSTHPVYNTNGLQTPPFIQIACVLWRFANTHFGYGLVSTHLGISQGSYHNFTSRFLTARIDTHRGLISWPDGEEVGVVSNGFLDEDKLLGGVIGAIEGKLVVIHHPHGVNGEY